MYNPCGSKGYAYTRTAYLSKDKKHVTATVAATDATVTGLTSRIENVRPKLCIDNFFSYPDLLVDLLIETINFYGTVRPY
jgi:hypothetical protein